MIYLITDRRYLTDYKPLLDVCKLVKYDYNQRRWPQVSFQPGDTLFCMSSYACPQGIKQINNEFGRSNTVNKAITRAILQSYGIPVPYTWYEFKSTQLPFIARPPRHTFGENFVVVRTHEDITAIKQRNLAGWYYSEILEILAEYRVIVFRGEVISSFKKHVEKTLELTLAWRKHNRAELMGSPVFSDIPDPWKQICIKSMHVVGLDYGGIDLMITSNGPVICEINVAPTIRPLFVDTLRQKIIDFNNNIT